MKTEMEPAGPEYIAALVHKLSEAESILREATRGQIDAVIDPQGHTILLRETQQALHTANERLRHLVRHTPAVIYSIPANDANSVPVIMSESITGLLGIDVAETRDGSWWSEFVQPDDRAVASNSLGRVRIRGSDRVEYRLRHRDGSYRWIEDHKRLVRDNEGEPVEVIGVWTDVTERHAAEERLRVSEASLAAAQRLAHLGNWEMDLVHPCDLSQCPTRWSDELFRVLGYRRDEVTPSCEARLTRVHPEDRPGLAQRITELVHSAASFNLIYRVVRPDGSERVVHEHAEFAAGMRPPRIIGSVQDITRRVRAEEARKQSEERFEKIFRASPLAIAYGGSADGNLIDANHQWLEFFGNTREEMIGPAAHPLGVWISPQDRNVALERVASEGKLRNFECFFRHKSGEIKTALLSIEPLRLGQERLWLKMLTDITERKKSEETLRLHSRVLESMAEGVNVSDENGVILFSNAACNEMFGYAPDTLAGMRLAALHRDPGSDLNGLSVEAAEILFRQGNWRGEVQCRKKDGSVFITQSHVTVLEIAGKTCMVAVQEDVTAKKQLEAQLLRAQRMESVGRLASGIAHDMNNILAPIMMAPPLLRDTLDPEQTERLLTTIETSADRGANLIKHLLFFGRGIEGQRIVMRFKDAVQEVEEIISETFPRSITIITHVAPDAWAIRADPTQVHQVLINLCVNARDAMPNGGTLAVNARNVSLDHDSIGMREPMANGPYLLVTVQDTGTGISPEHTEKIFDPFFTTKDAGKGTGLGLSTVVGIVKNHGGFVNVQSELGRGTTFQIYLPALPTEEGTTIKRPDSRPPMGSDEMVLLVDDEVGVREIARELLLHSGYNVVTATNGVEALVEYTRHSSQVKVVISDFDMPVMDGLSLVKELKGIDPSIKVIIATGLQRGLRNEAESNELAALGVTMLLKPFTPVTLLTTLREVLTSTQS